MRAPFVALVVLAASCAEPAPVPPPPEGPTETVAGEGDRPRAPAAPPEPARNDRAPTDLTIAPPRSGCERTLLRDDAGARIGSTVPEDAAALACLGGASAPAEGPVHSERVDLHEEGERGCGRRLRFTFRHDGVVVRTRCPDGHTVVVDAESTLGSIELTRLAVAPPVSVDVPWAGDWDHDGRLEWIVRVGDGASVRYLGAFGLRDDDTVATLAEHRPPG